MIKGFEGSSKEQGKSSSFPPSCCNRQTAWGVPHSPSAFLVFEVEQPS